MAIMRNLLHAIRSETVPGGAESLNALDVTTP
jgi:hypothetical protein